MFLGEAMAEKNTYKILFIGDVCGSPGRKMLEDNLAKLQWEHDIDFTVVSSTLPVPFFALSPHVTFESTVFPDASLDKSAVNI